MFVNFTNHPAAKWDQQQLEAAQAYGDVVDIAFPHIDPMATDVEVAALAQEYVARIIDMSPRAVLCQGEFTFVFAVVSELKKHGVPTLAACSERCVNEHVLDGATQKTVTFKFVQFRSY